jgi:hypothetical protein
VTWQPIETAPRDCKTVLTIHEDDLYPVPAFCVVAHDGEEAWLLETEGPEDTEDGRPDKFRPLYRTPTHWMPIPDGPIVARGCVGCGDQGCGLCS